MARCRKRLDVALASLIDTLANYLVSLQVVGNVASAIVAVVLVRALATGAGSFDEWNRQSGGGGLDLGTLRRATLVMFAGVMLVLVWRLFRTSASVGNEGPVRPWRTRFWRTRNGWVASWLLGASLVVASYLTYDALRMRTVIVAGDTTYYLPVIRPGVVEDQMDRLKGLGFRNNFVAQWATENPNDATSMGTVYTGRMIFTSLCYMGIQAVFVTGIVLMVASPITRREPAAGDGDEIEMGEIVYEINSVIDAKE